MGKPPNQDTQEASSLLEFITMKKKQTKSNMKWYSGELNHFFSGSLFYKSKPAEIERIFQGDY